MDLLYITLAALLGLAAWGLARGCRALETRGTRA